MENKVYETTTRYFLNKECRIVLTDFDDCLDEDNQWLVLKDMFSCLGRLDKDGNIRGEHSNRVREFMEDMGWKGCLESFTISSNSKSQFSKKAVSLPCVRLTKVPILITQFTPRKDNPAYEIWVAYMHYVNQLLLENRVLDKLFARQQGREEALKPFQDIHLTTTQGAKMTKCKNGSQFTSIIERMGLVKFTDHDITNYDTKFFDCTKKQIRIRIDNVPDLVERVLKYKYENNIPDCESRARRKAIRVRCVETGHVFNSITEAQKWLGKGSVWDCIKGSIKTTGGYHFEKVED